MNSALSAQDESLFPKQSHEPPLHNRCPLLNPKETLAAGYPLNTHALSLFSPWKYCSTDPLEILFGSVGEGSKEEERRERGKSDQSLSFSMCLFWRGRNQRMGSSKDIERGLRQTWISGYLCWHETTKLNSVQLNPPFPPRWNSEKQRGKINSVCIDINVQHYASKWNHSSRLEHTAFINNMCWNQITI